MEERDFCFWLWGFMELNYTDSPTVDQWKCIKEHLATVFDKKAPDVTQLSSSSIVNKMANPSPFDLQRAISAYSTEYAEFEKQQQNKFKC